MQASNRKQQGFTLVEVIVVAVIVAALAAVSVPLYLNYVTSSRTNAAANTAGSVASFMGACSNQAGAVTGLAAASASTDSLTLICTYNTNQTTTMKVPRDIRIRLTTLASPGTVNARHSADTGWSASYNF